MNDSQSLTYEQMAANEIKKNGGCGKKISVHDGKANHTSFCGCNYKGLHLCVECTKDVTEDKNGS